MPYVHPNPYITLHLVGYKTVYILLDSEMVRRELWWRCTITLYFSFWCGRREWCKCIRVVSKWEAIILLLQSCWWCDAISKFFCIKMMGWISECLVHLSFLLLALILKSTQCIFWPKQLLKVKNYTVVNVIEYF